MWQHPVDLFTIHVEHAVLLGTFTLLISINSLVHRGERGTRWFTLFTFTAFLGAVLICLRGNAPDSIAVLGSAILFSVSCLFMQLAFLEFYGDRLRHIRPHLLLVALSATVLLRWGLIQPHPAPRIALYSACLLAQLTLSTLFLARKLRGASVSIGWATGVMVGILVLLCANLVTRIVSLAFYGAPADPLQGSYLLNVTMLFISALQGTAAIAFVWMTAARLHDELRLEATTDPLTRLLNRRALGQWAEREIAISRENGWPLSAILIDLDEFKGINDSWGHHCGDTVLLGVADQLTACLRPGDQLGRLGGDEFVILLPRTPEEVALSLGECLRERLQTLSFAHQPAARGVRASFGIAELGGLGLTWEQLIQRCDVALYNAKALGGNCVLVH